MGKRTLIFMVVAVAAIMLVPAAAFAALPAGYNPGLTNDYGKHFSGQAYCTACHGGAKSSTVHSRFMKDGLVPSAPAGWTAFQSAGGVGESFSILGHNWVTLGDWDGGAATEYVFWNPAVASASRLPYTLVEGLEAVPGEGWELAEGGLEEAAYGCYQCHSLGATVDAADSGGAAVPNVDPALVATASKAWAYPVGKDAAAFRADQAVTKPGMSIQCESCHGTGVEATSDQGGHFNTGTKLSSGNPEAPNVEVLLNSQVCGACHASYTKANDKGTATKGLIGFTANQRLADFVNVSGAPAGRASYTKIPTEAEFLASPRAYSMFPNGDNATGHHFYYNEWQASAHSWRGALTKDDPNASAYQKLGTSHFTVGMAPISSGCYKCHTGEGYLQSKNASVAKYLPAPSASTVGFMGQECATCHTGHPSAQDPDAAGVVRAPDPAGVRSNTGRTTANASICEDCHNWQFEVQGTTPQYKPMTDLEAHGGASHPQRETLHGRSMVEIANASEFMPTAKCEDCHMPKTSYENNRYAHGMKPVLPADMEKWNEAGDAARKAAGQSTPYYEGTDSCTKCHPSSSPEELQTAAEDWQAAAKAQADDTAAAIKAAQARSEFSMTDASNPGYVLVGRATWNYKVYENDSSGSFHNPHYVVAGLKKAEQLADSVGGKFAAFGGSASILPGGTGFVSGRVVNGDGSGAAGASMKLSTGATTMSDANGGFTFIVTGGETAASYSATWQRSSQAGTDVKSATINVAVAKFGSKTTVKASASSIKLGKSVKISGKVTSDGKVSGKVKIKYRKGEGSWKSTSVSLSKGAYNKSFKPGSKGTWSYKAEWAGTSTVASSHSGTIKVKVK